MKFSDVSSNCCASYNKVIRSPMDGNATKEFCRSCIAETNIGMKDLLSKKCPKTTSTTGPDGGDTAARLLADPSSDSCKSPIEPTCTSSFDGVAEIFDNTSAACCSVWVEFGKDAKAHPGVRPSADAMKKLCVPCADCGNPAIGGLMKSISSTVCKSAATAAISV